MHSLKLTNHQFTTDGSRLTCDNHTRVIDYIADLTPEDIHTLATFTHAHMPWMDTNYTQSQLNEVRDSIHPIFEGINEQQRNEALNAQKYKTIHTALGQEIETYIDLPNTPKTNPEIPNREYTPEFLHNVATIYHASAPYLWDYDLSAAIDGFYNTYSYPKSAYASRNKKELLTQCFGAYLSSFPDMPPYMLTSLIAAFPNKTTPIDHIAEIAHHYLALDADFRNSIEYLPFAMNTPQIQLTPKRLIHWFKENNAEDVTTVIAQLVETFDMPYVETVSSKGSFKNVQAHCDRMLNLGLERMGEEIPERYQSILETAQGKTATFSRKPDANFDKYAIYMVRSALELSDLGHNLEVCLDRPMYARRLEEKVASFFVIEADNRQYVARIENNEIRELRGWKNHTPQDETVRKAAEMCVKELVGA